MEAGYYISKENQSGGNPLVENSTIRYLLDMREGANLKLIKCIICIDKIVEIMYSL